MVQGYWLRKCITITVFILVMICITEIYTNADYFDFPMLRGNLVREAVFGNKKQNQNPKENLVRQAVFGNQNQNQTLRIGNLVRDTMFGNQNQNRNLKKENLVREAVFGNKRQKQNPKSSVLLWTQMRSGSTLTQELMTVLDSFRTDEPLRETVTRRRTNETVELLNDILKCKFSQQLEYFKKWMFGVQLNENKVKVLCHYGYWPCADPALTDAMCRAARINFVRVVAADLSFSIPLLKEPSVFVIHLVRDPRALLTSRAELEVNKVVKNPDGTFFTRKEKSPTTVCDRYRKDLLASISITKHYPQK